MDKKTFDAYRKAGYTHVPLYREILADLDTPLSTYLKLAGEACTALFESVQGGERWGRYSIITLRADRQIRLEAGTVSVLSGNRLVETATPDDPLAWLDSFLGRYRIPELPGLPRFTGGLAGFISYDSVRYMEPRLAKTVVPDDGLNTPDWLLMVVSELVIFDNLSGRLYIVVNTPAAADHAWEHAQTRLEELTAKMRAPLLREQGQAGSAGGADFSTNFPHDDFCDAVRRARELIQEGDIMQVVLSQRLSIPYRDSPLDVYRALRCFNPSPYMYFLDFGDFQVVGSSPEVLVRLEQGEVTVRPIAGTRPRGRNVKEDLALEAELLADPKERAEHLMLIDLGRNDVGRVSETGSVKVTEHMVIERYSHVMHIVSNVVGKLLPGLSALDVLRACFPAGTLSGAPKIRAMEIIRELEPAKRGVYGGAVGYFGFQGTMDTAIAIRTAVVKDGMLHVQAGAGIVHDSVPENEWQETLNKGRAVFHAVEIAGRGLEGLDFRSL